MFGDADAVVEVVGMSQRALLFSGERSARALVGRPGGRVAGALPLCRRLYRHVGMHSLLCGTATRIVVQNMSRHGGR